MAQPRLWTEDERREALSKYQIVGSPPEEAFEEIVHFAADTCHTPIALISFVEELRQWFKAVVGLRQRETPRAAAICASAMLEEDVFIVPDLSVDPRFAANPLVVRDPRLRFYAGAPLKTANGVPLGTLSVLDVKPRLGGLDDEQKRALARLAGQVMVELELRREALERTQELCRFQQQFDEAPVLLSVVSPSELKFEYVNKAFRSLLPDRDLLGRSLHDAFSSETAAEYVTALVRTCETGQPTTGKSAKFSSFENRRYINFNHQPVLNDGRVLAVVSVGVDVTEEHVTREEANRLQRELELARQGSTVDVVSSMIAHEINQPLAAARNYVGTAGMLLEREAESASIGSVITAAGDQLDRAASIIRRLRKLAVGDRRPDEVISLSSCVESVKQLMEEWRASFPLKITVDYEGRDNIIADRIQIEQVFLNLFMNSAKAMVAFQCEPLLSLRTRDLDKHFIEVEISDQGPGIPQEILDHVFEPFHRSTSGGMGLGLAIVRSTVESLGGRITVANEDGATFRLALRAAETPEAPIAAT